MKGWDWRKLKFDGKNQQVHFFTQKQIEQKKTRYKNFELKLKDTTKQETNSIFFFSR